MWNTVYRKTCRSSGSSVHRKHWEWKRNFTGPAFYQNPPVIQGKPRRVSPGEKEWLCKIAVCFNASIQGDVKQKTLGPSPRASGWIRPRTSRIDLYTAMLWWKSY